MGDRSNWPSSNGTTNPSETSADAWLAAIVESSDDAIIGKTLDSIIRSWNAGATRIFGYQPEEVIGQSVLILIPPDRQDEEGDIVARLKRGDRIDHYETIRRRKDGSTVEVSLSVSPIRDKDGAITGAAKVARDITDAKRLQRIERESAEQLQQLASELEQQLEEGQSLQEDLEHTNDELVRAAERAAESRQQAEEANAAKSQFLAMISHELRTPLNAIAGYVELLEMEVRGPLTDSQRIDLARIKRSEESLLRLIDDVLSFAKLESGRVEYHFEPVPLHEFLESLEVMVAPRLTQKGLAYGLASCGPDDVVTVDKSKLEQIALNLLANAVKFTNEGRIDVRCTTSDTEFRVEFRDTGCGIEPRLLDSIFEPFVQGDRSLTRTAQGTGLGLAISRQFARGMGGDITVESTLNVGSTFTLSMPRGPDGRRR